MMDILIRTETEEEVLAIGESIHNRLVGTQDYIKSRIVLNVDKPRRARLMVFDDASLKPVIDFVLKGPPATQNTPPIKEETPNNIKEEKTYETAETSEKGKEGYCQDED